MTRQQERSRRRMVVGLGVLAAAVVVAACGVPTGEDSFDRIGAEDVPFRLAENTTTTTSTTTTTVPPTTAPPTSEPEAPTSTAEVTTTTLPTESVALYFLSRDGLQPVPNELPEAYGIAQLAAALEAGPPLGAAGVGLDTTIEEGLILDSTVVAGVVTVELDEERFDAIEAEDRVPASAQIVLTYTTNLRGVGQVSFTIGREPIRVPKGNGFLSEPGEPLSFDDYADLIAPSPVEPGSTEPGGTTTSTVEEPPADTQPDPDAGPDSRPRGNGDEDPGGTGPGSTDRDQ